MESWRSKKLFYEVAGVLARWEADSTKVEDLTTISCLEYAALLLGDVSNSGTRLCCASLYQMHDLIKTITFEHSLLWHGPTALSTRQSLSVPSLEMQVRETPQLFDE